MRHIVTALVFVAGLAIGFFVHSAGVGKLLLRDRHATALAAIGKLHQKDIEVTLSQDPKGLVDVWDENGVRINPGGPPVVGRQAIADDNAKFHSQYPDFNVFQYAPNIKEADIAIVDGWALEVGDMEATFKMSAKDNPNSIHDKGMRLLKRQSDGSWKFAVVGLK